MPLTIQALSTRARFSLGALVPAAIILATVLITSGRSSSSSPHVAQQPPPAPLPALVQSYANAGMGATGQLPKDWTAVRGSGFLRLANRDGTAVIVIASVTSGATHKSPLLRTALASIRKTYGSVTIKHGNGSVLGGLPGRSVVVYARNKRGIPIRILVAAAQGQHLAYVLESFTARRASERDLVETQQVVTTLRLAG